MKFFEKIVGILLIVVATIILFFSAVYDLDYVYIAVAVFLLILGFSLLKLRFSLT